MTLDALERIARDREPVGIAPEAAARVRASRAVVVDHLERKTPVYGVNTGFGALADVAIPADQLAALQLNLLRSHAAGVGEPLSVPAVRALMTLRANVLAKGFRESGSKHWRRWSRCSTPACIRAFPRADRSARAVTSRRSPTWRWSSSAKAK